MPRLSAYTPHGVDVELVDEKLHALPDGIRYNLVGVTAMTPLEPKASRLADMFRQQGVPVVMGGCHLTVLADEALERADSGPLRLDRPDHAKTHRGERVSRPTLIPPTEDSTSGHEQPGRHIILEEEKTMQRSKGVLLVTVILLFLVANGLGAEILTNDAIVTMVKAGFGQELIIGKIKASQNQFDLSTNSLLRLKSEGVSEEIIKVMIEASAKPESTDPKTREGAAAPPASARGEKEAIALYRQGRGTEAVAAFDKLLLEKPNDEGLKIWKALALLDQAQAMKESQASGYKPVVLNAWAILKPLGRSQAANAEWNLAVAKGLWLNERPERARRVAEKALALRPDFAEVHLLLGSIELDEPAARSAADPTVKWRKAQVTRQHYETTLAFPDLPPELRAEALFKMGMLSADLESKKEAAREYWEGAAAADPASRYGRMAEEKLKAVPAK